MVENKKHIYSVRQLVAHTKELRDSTRPAECLKRPTTTFKADFERSSRRSLDKGRDILKICNILKHFKIKEIQTFWSREKTVNG